MSNILEATMYFSYGKNKRPEVTSRSTFEAILKGERTSTTRFDIWNGTERWGKLQPGAIVRFYEDRYKQGQYIDVVVDSVNRIDLAHFSDKQFEEWSKVEGWSVEHAKGISSRGGAYQIRFHNPERTLSMSDINFEEIKDEAENISCRLQPLFKRDSLLPGETVIRMNSYDRPSTSIWAGVYENLRSKGWTQDESIAWLQSKSLSYVLDNISNGKVYDPLIETIAINAHKRDIPDPAIIGEWPRVIVTTEENILKEKLIEFAYSIESTLSNSDNVEVAVSQKVDALINELPKPDIFIAKDKSGETVYSNHPELLGTVVIHNDDNKMTFVSHAVPGNTQTLRGDSAEWIGGLFETNYDFAKFLEEFIILNT